MKFRGIYPAPALVNAPCGILSVVDAITPSTSGYNDLWERGLSYEFESQPTSRLLTVNDDVVIGGTLFDGTGLKPFRDYIPFFIEAELLKSMLGLTGEDRFAEVLRQLEASTQKAVERELWTGIAATANANANDYLTKASTVTEVSDAAHSAAKALQLLEGALAGSPVGAGGVIHMTRDVASILDTRIKYYPNLSDPAKGFATTRIGTPVVIGSGYTGQGIVGDVDATASLTNKWMFATGPLAVLLGESEVVNDTLAQGANTSINDMRIKALRSAAVYFDPSCHYAAQVTLP